MKINERIKGADLIVFDFDGSIVDSLDTFLVGFQKAMLAYDRQCSLEEVKNNLGPCSFAQIRKQLIPKSYKVLARLMRGSSRRTLKKAHEHFHNYVLEHIDEIDIFPDAASAIKKLSRSKRLALLTNSDRKYTTAILKKVGLLKCFSLLVYGDSGFADKSKGLKHIMKKLKVPVKKTVYIGDAPLDMKAARKAGCTSAAIIRWYPVGDIRREKPNYIMKSMMELC